MTSEQLATIGTNEAVAIVGAVSHEHLKQLWDRRLTPDALGLSEAQARVLLIAQNTAYMFAQQQLVLRAAHEVLGMMRVYADVNGGVSG